MRHHGGMLGAIAATMIVAGQLGAQPSDAMRPPIPQLVTIAQGDAKVTPDRALIEISVQTRAPTAAAAGAENARKQTAVLAALRAMGLAPAQLTTSGYNLYPEMQYDQNGERPRVTAYVATNSVRVELRRIEQAGQAIDVALGAGANMISSLSFFAANTDSARRAAIGMAVTKARADADAMARAAGGSVGGVLEMSIAEFAPPAPMYREMAAQARQADATPVSPGQQTVTVTVSVRWRYVSPN